MISSWNAAHKVAAGLVLVMSVTILVLTGCVSRDAVVPQPQISPRTRPIVQTNTAPEFKEYDEAMVNAIRKRWHYLLDHEAPLRIPPGKVVVGFNLRSDGRIPDIVVFENTSNRKASFFCEVAIRNVSPFPAWPEAMKQRVGQEYRTIRMTFYYRVERDRRTLPGSPEQKSWSM